MLTALTARLSTIQFNPIRSFELNWTMLTKIFGNWIELLEVKLNPLPYQISKSRQQVHVPRSLNQCLNSVHASIISSFRPFRWSVIRFLADENTLSHSADIIGIEKRSRAICDNRGYSWRWAFHHSNGLSHGRAGLLRYSSYSSRVLAIASSS